MSREVLTMQTLVAFAFHHSATPERVPEGLSRVERWYVVTRTDRQRLPDVTRLVRFVALRANDIPLGRKLARTDWGQRVRRRLGV